MENNVLSNEFKDINQKNQIIANKEIRKKKYKTQDPKTQIQESLVLSN